MKKTDVILCVFAAVALPGLSGAARGEDRVVHVAVRADSEHPGMEAFRLMDGNPGTIWNSLWRPREAMTDLPHEIVVDLGEPREITGFTYLPRTDGSDNGTIVEYEVYLSDRPEAKKPLAAGTPVAKGIFEKKKGENVVTFAAPRKGRYFRLRALSDVTGNASWAGGAELTLHAEGVKFVGEPWALATGDLRLPKVLGDHMVLQRDVPPVIWGWGAKGNEVTVALDGDNTATAKVDDRGAWRVTLKAVKADGKPHKLVVTQDTDEGEQTVEVEDILIGDVWVGSGQSNMEWGLSRTETAGKSIAEANHPKIRLFHVPRVQSGSPARDVNAVWRICSPQTVPNFSAVLYHFGKRLHQDLEVPIGLINSSWGGSPIEPWTNAGGSSGGMYNGMIAPLVPFPIRGAIWYQGETNVINRNGFTYFDKMKALIEGWRTAWGSEIPFYFVQIAPWNGGHYQPGQLPALWEAQVASLKIPKTGMAVTTDIVHNIADIHPANKRDVGKRLALWALARTYGVEGLVHSGPLYKSMKVEGDKIRIGFAHTGGGLMSRDDKPLSEFQIAGADGKFVPATATIDGKTVVVASGQVPSPTQVRFGWHKTTNPNLVNKEGLPASPFQTEGWRGGTGE